MSNGQKILVADDSLTIRKLVETVLSQEGYEILTAETGADCLAQAAAQKPSLILLDYILPDKQGTEICRQLINSPETWEIPVLMMSSNGNAIRQLYQDLNNVADYLTKPFAPNVLKAVVGHILEKPTPASPAPATPEAGTAAAAPSVSQEMMDKVTRLLDLMETTPADAALTTSETPLESAPKTARKSKPRRSRKSVASAPTSDALQRKFRLALQKHLRSRMGLIPDWETTRGIEDAEEFYLSRLLSKEVMNDLSASLVRATGAPADAPGALHCPASLLGLDAVLRHLQTQHATGELRVSTAEETILVCIEAGQVVLLSTNHPRNYCAGAPCDFGSVPHSAIGEAVRAQEEQSIPFFLSLREGGHLPADLQLESILRTQGEKCLSRAFIAADASISFFPQTRLPAMVRACKLEWPLDQLLLICYRAVDDWFTLEKAFPDLDATLVPATELKGLLSTLNLLPEETQVLAALSAGRTLSELVESTGLKQFEVCRLLFGFIKLGLVRHGPRRSHDERVDEQIPLSEAGAEAAPAPAAPPPSPSTPSATLASSEEPGTGLPVAASPAVVSESALLQP